MLQIISLVDITPSGKRSWTWSWTASGSLLTTATCLHAQLLLCVCLSRHPNRFGRFRHPRHRTPRLLRLQRMRRRNRIRPWLPHAREAVGGCAERGLIPFLTVLKFRAQAKGYAEDLVSSQGCPWIMARRARSPSPCGAALRWLLPSSSRTTQSCACIPSWSTPM